MPSGPRAPSTSASSCGTPTAPAWTASTPTSPPRRLAHLPDLTLLLRRHPIQALTHRCADWAIRDTDLLGHLEALARTTDDDSLAVAATVTAARLGGDPDAALRLLEHRLADSARQLEEAGRLGEAASPLLP
ncbi:hypothetical protein GCM10018790_75450 [Kitasatospora xanthocidica]|uniref:hypothetical protein n=1 Tax=Kitasatospora xanthocidica TaxID=83382 RepID=UPI0016774B87|nr:hypothetical protein [Kitasatospora xanthocidica]GHF86860.1 hypothetical protein GCM10018790_75450 [Kitasatospora xanthocidica]